MSEQKTSTPFLSNHMYDRAKWVTQILLPALGTLYFSLSEIWDFPKGVEVVGTITVIDFFLGILLGLSTKQYNDSEARFDGTINIENRPDSKLFMLNLNGDPEALGDQNEVVFKVKNENVEGPM